MAADVDATVAAAAGADGVDGVDVAAGADGIVVASGADAGFDRAELARMAGLPRHVVDLVVEAGLLAPAEQSRVDLAGVVSDGVVGGDGSVGDGVVGGDGSVGDGVVGGDGSVGDGVVGGDEHFGSDAVDMLSAARTFVSEGVAMEELAALAMRHAANVEAVIDDAIDLCKRHVVDRGLNRAQLAAVIRRLVPVATELVAGHFERTLTARSMARIDGRRASAGAVIVCARRLDERVDPLAVYAAADPRKNRMLWLRPSAGFGLAAMGSRREDRSIWKGSFLGCIGRSCDAGSPRAVQWS